MGTSELGRPPKITQSRRGITPDAHLQRSTRQAESLQASKQGMKGGSGPRLARRRLEKRGLSRPRKQALPLLGANIAMGLLCYD